MLTVKPYTNKRPYFCLGCEHYFYLLDICKTCKDCFNCCTCLERRNFYNANKTP